MKSRKFFSLISAIALATSLAFTSSISVYADQTTGTASGTQTATPDRFVEASIRGVAADQAIDYGILNISGHASTVHSGKIKIESVEKDAKLVMFNSLKDVSNNKEIKFTEGATNANAYYTIGSEAVTDAKSQGIADWLYYTNTTAAKSYSYVPATISGTLATPTETYTGITGTVIGACKSKVKIFGYDGAGDKWNIPVETEITIVLVSGSNGNELYVGSGGTDLSAPANFVKYSKVGDMASPTFCTGNNYVLTKVPSSMTADDKNVTLTFGYNSAWNLEQNSTSMNLATLIDLPESAASDTKLDWNIKITGNWLSNP